MNEQKEDIFRSESKENRKIESNLSIGTASNSSPQKSPIKIDDLLRQSEQNCTYMKKQGELLQIQNAIYKPIAASLCQSHFHVKSGLINLTDVEKIKIYPNKISTKYYEIKLNVKEKEIYFAASSERTDSFNFPQHFQWFRHLIQCKLESQGIKIPENYNYQQEKSQLGVKIESIYIEGLIFKKSKYLKKWDKRYTVISSCGFYSFKNVTDSNFSYFIKPSSITEIWTRFDLLDNNECLIIKLMHGQRQKAEFGIPLASLKTNYDCRNWLYQFYRLMQEGKGNKLH